jgi:hypothetical protein
MENSFQRQISQQFAEFSSKTSCLEEIGPYEVKPHNTIRFGKMICFPQQFEETSGFILILIAPRPRQPARLRCV